MSVAEGNTAAEPTDEVSQSGEMTAWGACQEGAAVLRTAKSRIKASENDMDIDQKLSAWLGLAEGWRHLAETMNGGADSKRPIAAPRKDDDERR